MITVGSPTSCASWHARQSLSSTELAPTVPHHTARAPSDHRLASGPYSQFIGELEAIPSIRPVKFGKHLDHYAVQWYDTNRCS